MAGTNRREFLKKSVACSLTVLMPRRLYSAGRNGSARVLSQEVFISSPGPGVGAHGASYYTTLTGGKLVSIHGYVTRSDTVDISFVRYSSDNGFANRYKSITGFYSEL